MLRDYQEITVQKMLWGIKLEGNGIVSVPTGGGKTHIIAEFVDRLQKPVLILVPSKELLEQNLEKLLRVVGASEIGVFSASVGTKVVKKYTLATIQSAYKHPELFAHYEVVLIDECDLLNPKNLEGMYNKFFQAIGNPHIIGLTATPFRMDSYYRRINGGYSYRAFETVHTLKMLARYKERFWARMLHVVQVEDLIKDKFLTPLTYKNFTMVPETQLAFNKSKSEIDLEDFEGKFNPFIEKTADLIESIKSTGVLVFCATITQAQSLSNYIKNAAVITGETPKKEREQIVANFRSGKLRVVLNVGVLLVGFDKPDLDTIVVARPTRSLRLHLQLLGRGMRIAPGKKTCTIYDLVGNTKTLGTAESIKIEKVDMKWNVTSNTRPNGWHYAELYSHRIRVKDEEENEG